MKDKLIELILEAPKTACVIGGQASGRTFQTAENIANHLIANDVTVPVRCKKCVYWKDRLENQKGFLVCPKSGMLVHSEAFCSYGEPEV